MFYFFLLWLSQYTSKQIIFNSEPSYSNMWLFQSGLPYKLYLLFKKKVKKQGVIKYTFSVY